MLRIIGSVLAGYIAVGILVALTDLIFAAAIPGFRTMAAPPLYYFVIVTFTDTIYTIGGGYLCAATARASARTATLGLMICGEIAASSQPSWAGTSSRTGSRWRCWRYFRSRYGSDTSCECAAPNRSWSAALSRPRPRLPPGA